VEQELSASVSVRKLLLLTKGKAALVKMRVFDVRPHTKTYVGIVAVETTGLVIERPYFVFRAKRGVPSARRHPQR
jgi:hypothetical protein